MICVESSGVHVREERETFQKETRTDEEHHGQSGFGGDKRGRGA